MIVSVIIAIVALFVEALIARYIHQKKVSELVRSHKDGLHEIRSYCYKSGWDEGFNYQIQQWEIDHHKSKSTNL